MPARSAASVGRVKANPGPWRYGSWAGLVRTGGQNPLMWRAARASVVPVESRSQGSKEGSDRAHDDQATDAHDHPDKLPSTPGGHPEGVGGKTRCQHRGGGEEEERPAEGGQARSASLRGRIFCPVQRPLPGGHLYRPAAGARQPEAGLRRLCGHFQPTFTGDKKRHRPGPRVRSVRTPGRSRTPHLGCGHA